MSVIYTLSEMRARTDIIYLEPPKITPPLVIVGNTALPAPSKYKGRTADIVDSGRNASGDFIGAVVAEDYATVSLQWNVMKPDVWARVLQLFISKYGGGFVNPVTFLNETINMWETRYMYPSDRTSALLFRNQNGSAKYHSEGEFRLIQAKKDYP